MSILARLITLFPSSAKAPLNVAIIMLFPTFALAAGAAPSEVISNDNSAFLLGFYVLLALVTSFLCSIAEAVLLSITPSYIEGLKTTDPGMASKLKKLKIDNVDQSLAAILTLNTIAHTVGAIGAGAQATAVFGNAWFGVFSAVMTLLVLVLSEIIPKTIGAVYWQSITKPTIWYVNALVTLLYPLVWLSERLTKLIARDKPTHVMSREEFAAMAKAGEASGEIQDNESRIINNLLQLRSLTVSDVMTPSTVIEALQEGTSLEDTLEQFKSKRFSRWPVYTDDLNDISGFVLRSDVLLAHAESTLDTSSLAFLSRKIERVSLESSVSQTLETFLRERLHIAVVIDEHGATRGIVTLEDLIETLIGVEIMDEVDTVEDMRALARKLWRERSKELGIESSEIS